MPITVTPLSDACGAEISGADLREPLDAATVRAIEEAFHQHVVVVFRGQDLTEEDQRRFATAFGDGEMWFHHDTSYYEKPHKATLLYSMTLPSRGGNTCFANMYKAYENVPADLKKKLDGRKVLQLHDYKRRERIDIYNTDISGMLRHEQPIFVTHPATGRKALYISRLMSARIEGLAPDENEAILEQLFDISEDPSIVFEHEWKLGDLVMWDNYASIHMRRDFPRDEPRLMRRLTLEGYGPLS